MIERDAEGKALRLFGAHIDVTEQVVADLALRQSEEQFRKLADQLAELNAISFRAIMVERMRVLIVEDEPKMASLIRRGLREEGIAADVADRGRGRALDGRRRPTTTRSCST